MAQGQGAKEPINILVGQRLREVIARQAYGEETVVDIMAGKFGQDFTAETLRQYMDGEVTIPPDHLAEFCDMFGVRLPYFFT